MKLLFWREKSQRIKANWTDMSPVKRRSMVVMTVCFNTRIGNSALNALMALGIQKTAAENALKKVKHSSPEDNNLESIIKKSLQLI